MYEYNEVELNKELSKLGSEPFFIDNPEYLYNIFKKSKRGGVFNE